MAHTRDSLREAIEHIEAFVREHCPEGWTVRIDFNHAGATTSVHDDEWEFETHEPEVPHDVMELCQHATNEIAAEFPDDEDDEF